MTELLVRPVAGVPEVRAGDDLAALLVDALRVDGGLVDGDVLVVSSKVVAKAEGRQRAAVSREAAISEETVRVVATRGRTRIVETRHGLVMAAAGVDASNVDQGTVLLLPEDPDASARRLRDALCGAFSLQRLGIVISDTAGRAWRQGQVDIAVGVAGIAPLLDLRGSADARGRSLDATVVAVADELAAAAELVRPKAAGVPAAVVRTVGGLALALLQEAGPGAAALVRPAAEDMFRLGTEEARREGARGVVADRVDARAFTDDPVDPAAVQRAVDAALRASLQNQTGAHFVLVGTAPARERLTAALDRQALHGLLLQAPCVVVPCVVLEDDRDTSLLGAGAVVQSFLLALAAEELGSAWVRPTATSAQATRAALDLPAAWHPVGAVALGRTRTS